MFVTAITSRLIMPPPWRVICYRRVATSLFPAFNQNRPAYNPAEELNLKETGQPTGIFGIEALSDPSGFSLLRDVAINSTQLFVKEAVSKERKRKMVVIFDQMSNQLCKVADLAEFIRISHPSARYRTAAQETSLSLAREVERLNTNRELYEALKMVVRKGDIVQTDEVDKLVAKLFLFDFELSGIHLPEAERSRVLQINEYISHVGGFYYHRSCEPNKVPKDEVPQHYWDRFSQEGQEVVIDSPHPEAEDDKFREVSFKLYYRTDEHREKLLRQLLAARKVLSKLCGFPSYADRAVQGSILGSDKAVHEFLENVNDGLRPHVQADYSRLLRVKQRFIPDTKDLKPWDYQYYIGVVKQTQFSEHLFSASPYFSVGACMEGLNLILDSIFGVRLKACEPMPGELWSPDVVKLEVLDENDNQLGHIFCDFFERVEKMNQDCHFTIQGGCQLPDGGYQNPIVVLVLSLPRPSNHSPSLLTPHQVDNLFHEMGHAIHSMLARTPYQHTTGTRCSTDLAEVPSILMEYFLLDKRVVSSFAKHFGSGNPIPEDLLEAWIASKKLFTASETQLQLFYAALDQAYHGEDPLLGKLHTSHVMEQVCKKYYGLEYIPGTSFQLRFGHLFSYGAKYYSYLLSRAVASQIWDKVFSKNPLSREAGKLYLSKVLAHGGAKPASDIVKDILENPIDPKYFSDALIDNVVKNNLVSEAYIKES